MAIEHGSTVPGAAITKEGKGHKSELQALADVISKPMMVAKSTDGLESGKQPSYGKRNQLIHDDINDPPFQFRRFSQE